ncbi:putative small auxin-up RNA [Rosa chinensis]|uniref:Putative small auxin-up RNA n=1 Tax=Rosa chinensis TaxID=74649 RepID=A0A2P6PJF2_ROSCH|nr:putative small auxin-up RNA [Rosa chinensis]
MGIKLLSPIRRSLHLAKQLSMPTSKVPKGHFAVSAEEEQKKRFIIPILYLNQQ